MEEQKKNKIEIISNFISCTAAHFTYWLYNKDKQNK